MNVRTTIDQPLHAEGILSPGIWAGRVFQGRWIPSERELIEVREPATDLPLGTVGSSTPGSVLDAVDRAKRAQLTWQSESPEARARIQSRTRVSRTITTR
nr:aldehyde dehydrogenase family protein [Herbaspirillum huttiense]